MAVAVEDGWAIVEIAGVSYLVRPPYNRHSFTAVDKRLIERAVLVAGFVPIAGDDSFESWDEVIAYLNRRLREARAAVGQDLPESVSVGPLLESASLSEVSRLLDRVEKELLTRGKFQQAEEFVLTLLRLPQVCQDASTVARAVALLQRSSDMRESRLRAREELLELDRPFEKMFPAANRKYSMVKAFAKKVVERRRFFVVE